ncbi:unnamed protein product [Porites lobata]|uniref:DOMON domain-containing protein n=1 Tax=Porites lobata TaxID=104759 RepID=A0ABN8MWV6_9CNID|nr:unnamed protein product [Porites lobata]
MSPALLVAFSALLSISIADLSSEYAHHAVLDPAELLKLYWTVDWDKETISFAVEAATTGWVGFGFSSGNGMMVGSDVVIGWVKDSKGYLTDRYADAKSLPPKDSEQNYILTGFEEIAQTTVLKFKRKFDTCDSRDRKIKEGTTKVVFAYHTEDPETENDFKQHTFRGSRSILLLNNMDKKQVDETGWKSFVVQRLSSHLPLLSSGAKLSLSGFHYNHQKYRHHYRHHHHHHHQHHHRRRRHHHHPYPRLFLCVTHIYCQECNCKHFKVTIPKKHTTYWCSLIKAPKITSKHHITKIEPYIQKGKEGFVHHFLVTSAMVTIMRVITVLVLIVKTSPICHSANVSMAKC